MFCNICGTAYGDGSKVCNECGTVGTITVPQQVNPPVRSTSLLSKDKTWDQMNRFERFIHSHPVISVLITIVLIFTFRNHRHTRVVATPLPAVVSI
jgi:hypothetical protein